MCFVAALFFVKIHVDKQYYMPYSIYIQYYTTYNITRVKVSRENMVNRMKGVEEWYLIQVRRFWMR